VKRIGIHEIARLANVSIGTVDRALHNRKGINANTRQRIIAIAERTGYQPNSAARALSARRRLARIGVCIPLELHYFYDQVRQGVMAETRRNEHLGISLSYRPVDHLGAGEVERVEELISSDIQGLIVVPGDPVKLTPLLNEAEEKGIRVICIATDAASSNRSCVVCVDPEINGRIAGELMGKFVAGGARVGVVTGMLHTEDHLQKVRGFTEIFPKVCKGGRITDVLEGHEDDDETFVKCSQMLRLDEGLAGIYVSTANCLPVCRAVNALGLNGKTKVIATDLFREMVPYFQKGTIVASIYQRPYAQGQRAVRILIDHLFGKQPVPCNHYLSPGIVLNSNLHLFREVSPGAFSDGRHS
jgi:LacI family transcriptional regulator